VPVVELTCEECIEKYPELADYSEKICSADELCAKVRDCALKTHCFKEDFPGACYCGLDTNVNDCVRQEGFVPHGPCAQEIIAASGKDQPKHPEPLKRYFDPTYSAGGALLLVDQLSRKCHRACAFERLTPVN
jgi:hypothetical protein